MKPYLSSPTQAPVADPFEVYDSPQLQQQFLIDSSPGINADKFLSARLQLDNIRCAGCCGAIERMVNTIEGIRTAELNYSTHQLRLTWDKSRVSISKIMRKIDALGYPAHPVKADLRIAKLEQSRKQLIRQIGVASGFGMQIMVLAVCLYAGDWWGIEPVFEQLFKYLSFALVIPILMYSAQPFLNGALDDLRHRRVGMDVPIALGLSVAFCASVYSIYSGSGEIYFDSITMFVVLVLGARLVELGNRIKANAVLGQYDSVLPDSAVIIDENSRHLRIATTSLKSGDIVYVDTGAVVPADGIIQQGESSIDESLLTGESMPVTRIAGDNVVAGSINVENPLTVTVVSAGADTLLSGIARLVGKAQFEKPRVSHLVERLLSSFVMIVLLIAFLVAVVGYITGSELWLSATIAVLIVSCPCALALATPAAISMSMSNALSNGLLVLKSRALDTLNRADHYFFDKTGTLTTGKFELSQIDVCSAFDQERAINMAVALERYSSHPIAQAFQKLTVTELLCVENVLTQAGGGLSGIIAGSRYYLGNGKFILATTGHAPADSSAIEGTIAVLADDSGILCTFTLQDTLRAGAVEWIQAIRKSGIFVTLLSGDNNAVVESVAKQLGIDDFTATCSPEDKLARIVAARKQGEITVMIGDGINDAPVIGAAHVSVAVGERVNLSTANADIVAMNPQTITALVHLTSLSKRLTQVIRQNLIWALGYNAIAIPFAATGLVPPWAAAIGMSLSSLVVVLNAARLGRWRAPVLEDAVGSSVRVSPVLAATGG